MATHAEIENAVQDAAGALDGIAAEAERFVGEYFGGGLFGFNNSWSDACGRRIGGLLCAAVNQAVGDNIDIYNCKSDLARIAEDLQAVSALIDEAKRELQ